MLTVEDILKLEINKNFRLAAGKNGLHNEIKSIGIHDYESVEHIPDSFSQGDFVLTSLSLCQGNTNEADNYLEAFMNRGVSGIVIKEVFYHNLSDRICRLANEKAIPVFFCPAGVWAEDIIISVYNSLDDSLMSSRLESIVSNYFDGNISADDRALLNSRFGYFNNKEATVMYMHPVKSLSSIELLNLTRRINRSIHLINKAETFDVLKYHSGIFLLYRNDSNTVSSKQFPEIFADLDIKEKMYTGYTEIPEGCRVRDILRQSMLNSMYACIVATAQQQDSLNYDDIGIYRHLFPLDENSPVIDYYHSSVRLIMENDKKTGNDYLEMLKVYGDTNGEIVRIARETHQHPNTVRYRIQKIRSLLGFNEKSEKYFHEEIMLVMRIHKVYDIFNEFFYY